MAWKSTACIVLLALVGTIVSVMDDEQLRAFVRQKSFPFSIAQKYMPVLLAAKKVGPSYYLTSALISEKAKRGLGEVELKFQIAAVGSELGRTVVGRGNTSTSEGVGEHVRASTLYETYDA